MATAALTILSLVYVAYFASQLGEDYRHSSAERPSTIRFFPAKPLPSALTTLVSIQNRLVHVYGVDHADYGCGVLLGTADGVHYVYDKRSTFRYPVGDYVLQDLNFDADCNSIRLVPVPLTQRRGP